MATTTPGTQDPLVGDLRRGGLLPLLVLHFASAGRCYGSMLTERIAGLTSGAISVNPNTMYPLLKMLEANGLLRSEWENPDRHSRRFYEITPAGQAERERLLGELGPRLERIQQSISSIRIEIASAPPPPAPPPAA